MGLRFHRAHALACIAVLLVATAGCDTRTTSLPLAPQTRVKPDTVTTLYLGDAISLAISEMNKAGSPYRDSIEVPPPLIEEIHRALLAVYGAIRFPARDSVVVIYDVHATPQPWSLIVAVDTSYAWTAAWRGGELLTGEPAVDSLVARYGLVLESYRPWLAGYALLGATRPLNLQALAPLFSRIAGVRYAQPNGMMGYNKAILASRQDDGWRLDYEFGSGDCPAGCIDWQTWSFFVAGDLTVSYLGSSRLRPRHGR